MRIMPRKGFTLVELLVVIAIITIVSFVVIVTLNPAELLKQARDATRVSDVATIQSAVLLAQLNANGGSLGTPGTTYLSLIDPTATTTAGTDCSGVGLGGNSYHCAASSTYKNADGTGWIPVNFTQLSAGSPLAILPSDPINSLSSGCGENFYQYSTDGARFQIAAAP